MAPSCSCLRGQIVAIGAALLACGPDVAVHEDDTHASTTEGSSPGTEVVSTTGSTATDPDTHGSTVSSSDSTTDETPGGECAPGQVDGELACEPRGPTRAEFHLPVAAALEGPSTCTVVGIIDDGEYEDVTLTCDEVPVEVVMRVRTVEPHRHLQLFEEEVVEIDYRVIEETRVADRYLTVRDEHGVLRFAAIDGVGIPGPNVIDLAPLELAVLTSDCASRAGECVVVQRAGLRATYDGDTVFVFDGHHDFAGVQDSYDVFAQTVTREVCWPDDCGINYYTWGVHALFFLIPEG